MPVPTPQDARHPSLEPYIERVAAFVKVVGDGDRPLEIPFGAKPLQLSAADRRDLWRLLVAGGMSWTDWPAWIALGTALHLAVASVLESSSMEKDDGAKTRRLGALNEVAGMVMDGLREVIAAMIASGERDDAKRLAEFRNKLFETLTQVRAATALVAPSPAVTARSADSSEANAVPGQPARYEPSDPALRPYLDRAAAFLRVRGAQDRPLEVAFGARNFLLGPWERRLAWRSLCDGQAGPSPWHHLVVEGLAIRLAMLMSLEESDRAGQSLEAAGRVRQTLDTEMRLAGGVVERIRDELERLVSGGVTEDAKRLTAFRNGLNETVREARRVLAEGPAGGSPPPAGEGTAAAAPVAEDLAGRLQPYLERAGDQLRLRGREDRPLAIPVGGRPWALTGWERLVLWKVLCEEGQPPPPWARLLAQAGAAQLGVLEALERIQRAEHDGEARSRARTEHAQAVALAEEAAQVLESAANDLAEENKTEFAGRLRSFHAKVVETTRLRPRLQE